MTAVQLFFLIYLFLFIYLFYFILFIYLFIFGGAEFGFHQVRSCQWFYKYFNWNWSEKWFYVFSIFLEMTSKKKKTVPVSKTEYAITDNENGK